MNTTMYYRSPFFSRYPTAPLRISAGRQPPRPPQPPVMCEPPWQLSGDKCVLPTRGHGRRGNPTPNQVQPGVQGPTGWTVKNGRYVPPNAPPSDTLGNVWIWTQGKWAETNLAQLLNSNPNVAAQWNKTCVQAPGGRRVVAFVSVYGFIELRVYCIYAGDSMPIPLVSKPQRSARALQTPVGPGWIQAPVTKPPKECPPGFYLWGDKCIPRTPNPKFAPPRTPQMGAGACPEGYAKQMVEHLGYICVKQGGGGGGGSPGGGGKAIAIPNYVPNPSCPPGSTLRKDGLCHSGHPDLKDPWATKPLPRRVSASPRWITNNPQCQPGQFYSEDLGCYWPGQSVKKAPSRPKPKFPSLPPAPSCPPGQTWTEDLGCVDMTPQRTKRSKQHP